MKKLFILSILFTFIFIQNGNAKIWRVNNNTGITADFTGIDAAVNSASVHAGDTIHIEASAIGYGNCYLSKRLTIIGTGYFLSETAPQIANPKTEANTNPGIIGSIYFYPGSKGSVISGVYISSYCIIEDSLITVQRCLITGDVYFGDSYTAYDSYADTIRQNYITGGAKVGYTTTGKIKNILLYNNIIGGMVGIDFSYNINNVSGFVLNNSFLYQNSSGSGNPTSMTSANIVYQNNIFGYVNFGAYQSSNVYFNNICMGTGVPSGNSNVQNVDVPNVVYNDWTGSGSGFSSDSRYQLKTGGSNPAISGGTINSTTIDCGAFGGPAPYILSGMPNAPSIYALTVPTQINTGVTTMNITLSSQSH